MLQSEAFLFPEMNWLRQKYQFKRVLIGTLYLLYLKFKNIFVKFVLQAAAFNLVVTEATCSSPKKMLLFCNTVIHIKHCEILGG